MKKFAKFVRWMILNGVFISAGVAGVYYKIDPAMNVFLFMAWVTSILGLFSATAVGLCASLLDEGLNNNTPTTHSLAKMFSGLRRSVPAWFGISFDFFILGLIVVSGHYILGIFYLIQMVCEGFIFNTVKEVRGEQ
jgi:hypothetical protein